MLITHVGEWKTQKHPLKNELQIVWERFLPLRCLWTYFSPFSFSVVIIESLCQSSSSWLLEFWTNSCNYEEQLFLLDNIFHLHHSSIASKTVPCTTQSNLRPKHHGVPGSLPWTDHKEGCPSLSLSASSSFCPRHLPLLQKAQNTPAMKCEWRS